LLLQLLLLRLLRCLSCSPKATPLVIFVGSLHRLLLERLFFILILEGLVVCRLVHGLVRLMVLWLHRRHCLWSWLLGLQLLWLQLWSLLALSPSSLSLIVVRRLR